MPQRIIQELFIFSQPLKRKLSTKTTDIHEKCGLELWTNRTLTYNLLANFTFQSINQSQNLRKGVFVI